MATSGGQAIGSALTGGIQDISALLPLLGTEQCEDHIASALTNGYLYVAATPLSIFGSLGAARSGFKALLSATSIRRFVGANILADAGFKPQGENLSLIMLEEDRKSYCAEKRLASIMTDPRLIHLKHTNRIGVSSKYWGWNIQMVAATAVSCIVSITPYIHLNLNPTNVLDPFVRWAFPVIRAIGGFLTATMIQFVIQIRVRSIMRKRLILDSLSEEEQKGLGIDDTAGEKWSSLDQRCSLVERHVKLKLKDNTDLESGTGASPNRNESRVDRERLEILGARIIEANGSSVLRGTFLLLLSIGIIASVVGYVGCFTVVQGSRSSKEPLIWLCFEVGLSIVRIILWGLNPKGDDAPPVELIIELDKHAPLPTCTRTAEEIEETKILPLVVAPEFLKTITFYAGLLTPFSYPTISLYYTLTRRNHATSEASKRVLYITIFDHTGRTTRVYSEDWGITNSEWTYFYLASELTDNQGIPMTKIGRQIQNHWDDPIARNDEMRNGLAEHYHSILGQVNSGIGNRHLGHDLVESTWTLKLEEKKSEMQRFEEKQSVTQSFGAADTVGKFGGRGDRRVEKAVENGDCTYIQRDQIFLEQRRVEHKVQDLIRGRGKQIKAYMDWVSAIMDNELQMMKIRHIEVEPEYEMYGVQVMLMVERKEMELMLVDEVREWEEKLRECRQGVVDRLSFDDGMDAKMAAKLARRWKTDLWERLKDGELAMNARMNAALGGTVLKWAMDGKLDEGPLKETWKQHTSVVQEAWRPFFTDLREGVATSSPSHGSRSRFKKALDDLELDAHGTTPSQHRWLERKQKMAIRLQREVEDVQERLERGLEHCHEFRDSNLKALVELTLSDSKWLKIESFDEDVIKALKRNKHFIYLLIQVEHTSDADITRFFDNLKSTSCTSIHFLYKVQLPESALNNLSPNILSITSPRPQLEALDFALEQNRSRLEESRRTTVEFANLRSSWVFNFALSAAIGLSPSFTLRFFGPESSDHLTLQVIYHCSKVDACLNVELKGSLFTFPITRSVEFGLQNIMIGNDRKYSSGLTFESGHRNTLKFIVPESGQYSLRDVELLDKYGKRYDGDLNSGSDQLEEEIGHSESEPEKNITIEPPGLVTSAPHNI